MFFVNLPLRYILDDDHYLQLLLAYTAAPRKTDNGLKFGPEFGLDARVLQSQDKEWFADLAHKFQAQSIPCTLHLPFMDIRPGSPDALIREASRKRLKTALETASLFKPRRLIAHPSFLDGIDSADPQAWLRYSEETWSALIENLPPGAQLCLENTRECEPDQLAALVSRLDQEKCGVCFDVGHWFSFANGSQRRNLPHWLETLGPYIKHLHLHDNDGSGDQHKGLGQGGVPFAELFGLLERLDIRPGATLEPHTEEAFLQSLEYLQAHSQFPACITTPGDCDA